MKRELQFTSGAGHDFTTHSAADAPGGAKPKRFER
jgi:hypothetical protein